MPRDPAWRYEREYVEEPQEKRASMEVGEGEIAFAALLDWWSPVQAQRYWPLNAAHLGVVSCIQRSA